MLMTAYIIMTVVQGVIMVLLIQSARRMKAAPDMMIELHENFQAFLLDSIEETRQLQQKLKDLKNEHGQNE